jgi:hypothetical protein
MSAAIHSSAQRRAKAPKPLTPTELIQKHQKSLARAKKLYDRADVLLTQILQPFIEVCASCGGKKLKPGTLVKGAHVALTADGKAAILTDNFSEQDIVWGHGGVRHYGVKIIDV